MNQFATGSKSPREAGFVLATVLIFLLVLSVSLFFAAATTRSDIQVVTNLRNEKQALAIAEAGIHEALYRMSIVGSGAAGGSGANPVTISGVNSGNPFNPSLAPKIPSINGSAVRNNTNGASPYGLDGITPTLNSTAQILLTTSGPAAGTNNTVPTLQPISLRLPYSTSAPDGTVNLNSTANLTIGWDVCTAAAPTLGCSAANTIRMLPLSARRPVVKIVSTGQSGSARRKIAVWAVDAGIPGSGSGDDSVHTLGDQCGQGINMNGNTSLTAVGAVTVNGGAADTNSPLCTAASTGGAQSNITAAAINVSGNVSGVFNPQAQVGMLPQPDPLAALPPPCFGLNTTGCQPLASPPLPQNRLTNGALPATCLGTAINPIHCNVGSITLNPGIYYGGLSMSGNTIMNPGVYIIAGGGFETQTGNTGTTSVGTGGVTIYNTRNDNLAFINGAGDYGAFVLGNGNGTSNISASTTGPYQGILLFQDRNNTLTLDLQGGTSGNYNINGAIYAPTAAADLQGHTNSTIAGSIIVLGPVNMTGGSNITVGAPSTPCAACSPSTGQVYSAIAWQDF